MSCPEQTCDKKCTKDTASKQQHDGIEEWIIIWEDKEVTAIAFKCALGGLCDPIITPQSLVKGGFDKCLQSEDVIARSFNADDDEAVTHQLCICCLRRKPPTFIDQTQHRASHRAFDFTSGKKRWGGKVFCFRKYEPITTRSTNYIRFYFNSYKFKIGVGDLAKIHDCLFCIIAYILSYRRLLLYSTAFLQVTGNKL